MELIFNSIWSGVCCGSAIALILLMWLCHSLSPLWKSLRRVWRIVDRTETQLKKMREVFHPNCTCVINYDAKEMKKAIEKMSGTMMRSALTLPHIGLGPTHPFRNGRYAYGRPIIHKEYQLKKYKEDKTVKEYKDRHGNDILPSVVREACLKGVEKWTRKKGELIIKGDRLWLDNTNFRDCSLCVLFNIQGNIPLNQDRYCQSCGCPLEGCKADDTRFRKVMTAMSEGDVPVTLELIDNMIKAMQDEADKIEEQLSEVDLDWNPSCRVYKKDMVVGKKYRRFYSRELSTENHGGKVVVTSIYEDFTYKGPKEPNVMYSKGHWFKKTDTTRYKSTSSFGDYGLVPYGPGNWNKQNWCGYFEEDNVVEEKFPKLMQHPETGTIILATGKNPRGRYFGTKLTNPKESQVHSIGFTHTGSDEYLNWSHTFVDFNEPLALVNNQDGWASRATKVNLETGRVSV